MDLVRCSGRRQYDDANWSPIATNHLYLWYQHGMLGQRFVMFFQCWLLEICWNMLELSSPHDRRSLHSQGRPALKHQFHEYIVSYRELHREKLRVWFLHTNCWGLCMLCVLMITSARVTPVHIVSWDDVRCNSLWDQRLYSLHRLIDTARRRWLYETRLKANLGHL